MTSISRPLEILLPKDVAEIDVLTFDYTDSLGVAETITSATVTVSVAQGEDASPGALRSGSPQLDTPYVLQRVTGGLRNVTYLFSCSAVTSDSRTLTVAALLPVVSLGQP